MNRTFDAWTEAILDNADEDLGSKDWPDSSVGSGQFRDATRKLMQPQRTRSITRPDSQRFPSWNFVTFVVKGFSFTGLTEVSSSLTKTRQLIKFDLIGPISDEILGAYA
jgi:hypothetical protein